MMEDIENEFRLLSKIFGEAAENKVRAKQKLNAHRNNCKKRAVTNPRYRKRAALFDRAMKLL